MARLQTYYREKIVPDLTEKFGYTSVMQVPRLTKITLNMGVSEAVADKKVMDHAVGDLTKIAGQKPVVTKSKKAIAGFKIRDGVPIGCMVTLRGVQMFEFLDRFVTVALPRVRDFRGISGRSFDGRGNYNIGVKEQIIFPEIEYEKIDAIRGMNISITTTAKNDEECKALLAAFKFPFKNWGAPWQRLPSSSAKPSAKRRSPSTPRSVPSSPPSSTMQSAATKSVTSPVSSCRSSRAIPRRCVCAIVAASPAARAARSASLVWHARRSVNSPSRATFRA